MHSVLGTAGIKQTETQLGRAFGGLMFLPVLLTLHAWLAFLLEANMVTVVKTEPHPGVVKEVICRNCGATLNYVPKDVLESKVSDYTGDYDIVKFINCPPCGNKVYVK